MIFYSIILEDYYEIGINVFNEKFDDFILQIEGWIFMEYLVFSCFFLIGEDILLCVFCKFRIIILSFY